MFVPYSIRATHLKLSRSDSLLEKTATFGCLLHSTVVNWERLSMRRREKRFFLDVQIISPVCLRYSSHVAENGTLILTRFLRRLINSYPSCVSSLTRRLVNRAICAI